jgi:cytochrome o ubiquinol oxidase operon protein cyoD
MSTDHRHALASYITGFVLSLAFTLTAYLLVSRHTFASGPLIAAIVVLAVIQLLVQLVLFLHLGSEPKPRWNLVVSLFAALVVFILVFGSLWIMNNLNYHMMSPANTDQYIIHDEGVQP